MSDKIPLEITTDILCRLPVKSLLRFRCVSKPWCSQMNNPYFINLHLKHSTQTNSNLSVILSDYKKLYSVDLDSLNKPVEINLSFKHPSRECSIEGSCNGLLCICDIMEDIALFNPSTKQCHIVPFMPINHQRGFGKAGHAVWVYGLGYNHTNDDYKVVRIAEYYSSDCSFSESEVMVYSLKTHACSKLYNTMPYLLRNSNQPGVFVGGALHWSMARCENNMITHILVAFDLGAEDFKEVPPPPECLHGQEFFYVGVLGGCLTVLVTYVNVRADLWVMNKYGVKESWTKLLSVALSGKNVEVMMPLVYSKNGSQVLLHNTIGNLLWYDLEKKRAKDVHIHGISEIFDAFTCVGSLVQLNVHTGTHGKKQQAQEQKKKFRKKRDDFLSEGFKLVL